MATVSHAFAQNKIETALDRWYFTALALALIAISIAGFAPSVVATEDRRAPLSMLATVHGIVFFLWQILFLAQSLLIANRRVDLHRRMGVIADCVLAFMIPLGYATTVTMARRGFDLSGDLKVDRHSHGMYVDPLLGMLFPLTDLAVFGLLAAAALAYRRRKEIHMRLMVFANIVLMPAAMAHLILTFPPALVDCTADDDAAHPDSAFHPPRFGGFARLFRGQASPPANLGPRHFATGMGPHPCIPDWPQHGMA